ncbi:MAG: carboxypeptidase-like regulatory domain-containing protein [Acidobacteriota bacterium]
MWRWRNNRTWKPLSPSIFGSRELVVTALIAVFLLQKAWTEDAAERTQRPFGRIVGTVQDRKQGRIKGALITIGTGNKKCIVRSDRRGFFRAELRPDVYEVQVEAYLFRPCVFEKVRAKAGCTTRMQVVLEVEGISSGPPL